MDECARCHRQGYIDELSGWCQECLWGPLPENELAQRCTDCAEQSNCCFAIHAEESDPA